jgi:hypothetical protein
MTKRIGQDPQTGKMTQEAMKADRDAVLSGRKEIKVRYPQPEDSKGSEGSLNEQ